MRYICKTLNSVPNTSNFFPKEHFWMTLRHRNISSSTKDGCLTAHQLIIYDSKNRNSEGLCPALAWVNKEGTHKSYVSHRKKCGSLQWTISWNTQNWGYFLTFAVFQEHVFLVKFNIVRSSQSGKISYTKNNP